MSISTKIKNIIENRDITQKDLAKIAGVSEGAVSQWISGETIPKMGRLQKISIHFGVPVGYFLDDDEEDKSKTNMLRTPEEEAELNEYLEAVHNDPNLRMVFNLAKNAKKEDVEMAVEIIKTVLSKK